MCKTMCVLSCTFTYNLVQFIIADPPTSMFLRDLRIEDKLEEIYKDKGWQYVCCSSCQQCTELV